MIKGFIFDLDGVIVDTAHYHYLSWKRLANSLGFDFSETQNEQLKGVSRMRSLDIILQIGKISIDDHQKQLLANQKNQWYQEMIQHISEDEILPGSSILLNDLKEKHYKIAVASSSKNATTVLNVLKIASMFDAIVDGNQIRKSKPDPEVFLIAAQRIGLTPSECIVFEDAYSGIEAANVGGFLSVGIGKPDVLNNTSIVYNSLAEVTLDNLKLKFDISKSLQI